LRPPPGCCADVTLARSGGAQDDGLWVGYVGQPTAVSRVLPGTRWTSASFPPASDSMTSRAAGVGRRAMAAIAALLGRESFFAPKSPLRRLTTPSSAG